MASFPPQWEEVSELCQLSEVYWLRLKLVPSPQEARALPPEGRDLGGAVMATPSAQGRDQHLRKELEERGRKW